MNPPRPVQDGGLKQHLESVIQMDKTATDSSLLETSVEQLNAQDKPVTGLRKEGALSRAS
jgi:hypothetical protein